MRQPDSLLMTELFESFNPRTRKGCDADKASPNDSNPVSIHAPVKDATNQPEPGCLQWYVSIHAPVKDATTLTYDDEHLPMVSIHAPVKDATYFADKLYDDDMFQSTHP